MTAKFDLDLKRGQIGEELVKALMLGDTTVEIKTDYKADKSGNVAIEYECRGTPSGIAITSAEWWAIVVHHSEVVVFIKTERLKKLIKGCKHVSGGDDNLSKMALVPLKSLLSPLLKVKK